MTKSLYALIYQKKNKSVILLSTLYNDATITEKNKKPEIIMYYNSKKSGVDNMDKMAGY